MIRVVVADDEMLIRQGFTAILAGEPDIEVVGEAADGVAALAEVRRTRPDVVLMDIRMPVLDGVEATRRLTRTQAGVRVLVLTTFDLDEYVYHAMRAGAAGFLLKSVPREHLVAGIRTVAGGDALLAPAITRRLLEEFLNGPPPGSTTPVLLDGVTPRELDVLRLVGRGLSNAQIGAELFLAESTVKTHVANLLAKRGLRDRAQLVVLAYESGLLRPGA
ncbi:response regulator transcription factor [Planotetraspora kaengkrachanensis]|uniref:DNA-binding response regulator n=1 Tax=Planotetraspora kaengkrachanensis TaxID=575193 RepID=A0A8J3VB91_9ACTN|nr:response regulator transcription factor [Planotetraspora kaengkrachanensis]GIG83816.1 DNA-binding response regulator [Planotetraspora kaengkrachanensis]